MATDSSPSEKFPRNVRATLEKLRTRIRVYVWLEGIAAVLVALGIAFWIGLFLDWYFEPTKQIRIGMIVFVAVVLCWVIYRFILRRAFAKIADRSLALLMERKFEGLHDSLLTSVELADFKAINETEQGLLDKTAEAAESGVANIRLSKLFNFKPLFALSSIAILLIGSVVTFGILSQDAFGFWMKRIGLAEELWPRAVDIEVDGFPTDSEGIRTEFIAKDDEFVMTVRASLRDGKIAPKKVTVRTKAEDGTRGRDEMVQIGNAEIGLADNQEFKYTFRNVSGNLTLTLIGGDDRIHNLKLNIVDRPRLISMKLHCKYPTYMNKSPETLDVTGAMQIPIGTEITITGESTKPLLEARLLGDKSDQDNVLLFSDEEESKSITFHIPALQQDRLLLFSLKDREGITTRQPIRLSIACIQDPPPEIAVRLNGIGSAITPDARIPFSGVINDPRYGVNRAWFEYHISDGQPLEAVFASDLPSQQELPVKHSLDMRTLDPETKERYLKLKPGQKLSVSVHASDLFDLENKPHVGSSSVYSLEVVTPDKLQALLERRELSLRQRFETLLEKTHDTRRLLTRIEFAKKKETAIVKETAVKTDTENSEKSEVKDAEAKEIDDSTKAPEKEDPRVWERRSLRVASSAQNMAQIAQETLGVAESFDQIQAELVNNRVDTEDMMLRLRDAISEPLKEIALKKIPALEKQLQSVQKSLANKDEKLSPENVEKSIEKIDDVLVAMQQVLDKMVELESYNEVLDLIRKIIEDQDKLNKKTKQQQKERLRGLLD